MRALLLSLPLVFAASFAGAQDAAVPPGCDNANTQMEMDACASDQYQQADAELNTVYREAVSRLERADREFSEISSNLVGAVDALKVAQRAWIAFRDASCDLAGFEARGGTLERTIYIGCQTELTRKRTAELRDLLAAEWLK